MTEIYTPRLSISRNFQRPKENHGTAQKKNHNDVRLNRRGFGYFFYLTSSCTLTII